MFRPTSYRLLVGEIEYQCSDPYFLFGIVLDLPQTMETANLGKIAFHHHL